MAGHRSRDDGTVPLGKTMDSWLGFLAPASPTPDSPQGKPFLLCGPTPWQLSQDLGTPEPSSGLMCSFRRWGN